MSTITKIADFLGPEAESLLNHICVISKEQIHIPGPDWIDRIFAPSDF